MADSPSPVPESGLVAMNTACPVCDGRGSYLTETGREQCPQCLGTGLSDLVALHRIDYNRLRARAESAEASARSARAENAEVSLLAHDWMVAHDGLLGWIQARPSILSLLLRDPATYRLPRPISGSKAIADARAEALEEAAKIADAEAASFKTIEPKNDQERALFVSCFSVAFGLASAIRSLKTAPKGDGEGT